MKPAEIHKQLAENLSMDLEWSEGPVDFYVMVPPEHWKRACLTARDDENLLFHFVRSICGVDYPAEQVIEVVAHLFSYKHQHALTLKTRVDRNNAKLDSLAEVWPASVWHERETYDLLGVEFIDHPDLRRILLPEDWPGHPLRKDYEEADSYHEIPTNRPGYSNPSGGEKK